jgi:hypothetical protein
MSVLIGIFTAWRLFRKHPSVHVYPASSNLATTPVIAPVVRPVTAASSLPFIVSRSRSKSRH